MYNKEKLLANGDKWEPELAAAARAGKALCSRSVAMLTYGIRCTLSMIRTSTFNHDCT